MSTYAEISARLLRDASQFFVTVGSQNADMTDQMNENAAVFNHVADLIENEPLGVSPRDPQATHGIIAASLMRDAANFFRIIGEQNEALAEQMEENANVFESVAAIVETDPLAVIVED
jgi:hypothetical protein